MTKAKKVVEKAVEKEPLVLPEVGVENIKEATASMFYVLRVLMHEFKDGFDWNDIPVALAKLAGDEKFKVAMSIAWSGRDKLAAEAKDLDISETVELGMLSFNEIMTIVKIMR